MDAIRFDALAKSWIAEVSRRRTLAGVLVGALGALGRSHAEDAGAAKSGNCKKTCGECEFCKKGKCNKKDGKQRCKKGKCKPRERGSPCGVDGNCGCGRDIEGDTFCAAKAIVECVDGGCANSGECPAGRRCGWCTEPTSTACFPECGAI